MSNPSPASPPPGPPVPSGPPLDYQAPHAYQRSRFNRWWMVLLRIFAGIAAGVVSGGLGLWIASSTPLPWLGAIPPLAMFGGLLFVCIKYRRFGYVTGFILAPFLVVTALFITLLIVCGNMGKL